MTHFTTNDDEAESTTKEKIMLDKSFSGHSKKKTCQSCNLQDIMKQLWVLMKWQTKVSVRSYFKLLFHLILPTLCVLFYGYSVGNDMTEVNLGIGEQYHNRAERKLIYFVSIFSLLWDRKEREHGFV